MARKNNQLDHDGVLCNWCSSKLDLESLQSRCSLYLAGLWSSPDVPRQCLGISMFSVQRWATAGVLAKEDPWPLKQKRGKWLCANQREHYILGCKWKLLRCVGYHKKDVWIIFFFFFLDEIIFQTEHTMTGRLVFLFDFTPEKWALARFHPTSPSQVFLPKWTGSPWEWFLLCK